MPRFPSPPAEAVLLAAGLMLAACAPAGGTPPPPEQPRPPATVPLRPLLPNAALPPSAQRLPAEGFAPSGGTLRISYVSTFCLMAMCNPPGWMLHLAPDHRAQQSSGATPPDVMTERWSVRDDRLCIEGGPMPGCLDFWRDGDRTLARKDGGPLFLVLSVDRR